ncbi:MAG: hypothetical protein CMD59_01145 [Gammaproteobacteria bacterium]|nr:hypothetical protein [Gammaproteobacteria bacterium]
MSANWILNHLGMMVTNRNATLNHFQSLGVGVSVGPQPLLPYEEGEGELMFFQSLDGNPITNKYKTGGPHNFRDGNSQIGDCQLEIYPMKPGPGMFISEYLEKKGSGINHIAFNTDDIERDTKFFTEKGCQLVFNVSVNGKTIENYLDTRKYGDVMISLRPTSSAWENKWKENNLNHPLTNNWNFLGVGIPIKDLKNTSDYYLDLGFSEIPNPKKINYPNLQSNQVKVGPIIFEFFEPSESHPIHNEILIERGEGISDLVFLVDDLEVEKSKLLNRGTILLDSNETFAIFDTRKEGNTLIRLVSK